MQHSIANLTSETKEDHSKQMKTLKDIRAQHESSMVAMSDL